MADAVVRVTGSGGADRDGGVEDLDAAPVAEGRGGGGRPARAGGACAPARRALRAPGRVLAASAAVVVLGGVLGVHTRAVHQTRRDLDRAVASLVVSLPTGDLGPVGAPDAGGWSHYRVRVPVLDRGTRPVTATVLSVDTPHQRTRRAPPAVRLLPGDVRTVVLPVSVRCAGVPAPGVPPGAATRTTSVTVGVEVPGGRRVVRLRVPRSRRDADLLVQQLWVACAYGGQVGG